MRLSVFILLAAIIISCNKSTGNDSIYPMTIGSFELTSAEHARYIGIEQSTKSKMKADGDTVVISQPGDQGLTLDREDQYSLTMTIVDSSYQYGVDSLDVSNSVFHITKKEGVDFPALRGNACCKGLLPDRLEVKFGLYYSCEPINLPENPEITFSLFNTDSTHAQTYIFRVDRFIDTVDQLVCD